MEVEKQPESLADILDDSVTEPELKLECRFSPKLR